MRRRSSPSLLLVALLLLAPAFCGFSEDAVVCEEAAARLKACCPLSPLPIVCEAPDAMYGCAQVDIDSPLGRCILGRSCEDLRAGGTCAAFASGQPWEATCP